MRKSKISFTVILVMIIVIMIVPMGVLAEGEADTEPLRVELGGFNKEVGESLTYIGDIDNENFSVKYEDWTDYTNGIGLGKADFFETGKTYEYKIVLEPKKGFEFGEDSKIDIDEIGWDLCSSYVVNDEEHSDNKCLLFDGFYTPGFEIIESISLSLPEVIKSGSNPVYVTPDGDANYTIAVQCWQDLDGNLINDNDTFVAYNTYSFCIELVPNDGYRFTADSVIRVSNIEWKYEDCFASAPWEKENRGFFFGQYTTAAHETVENSEEYADITEADAAAKSEETAVGAIAPETSDLNQIFIYVVLICASLGIIGSAVCFIRNNR